MSFMNELATLLARSPLRRLTFVGLALFLWFAASAWVRPLAMPDEGRYLSVAWEMLSGHDWMVPTLDGVPFFHKPPLFYWLAAGAMRLLGVSAFAGRLVSIAAATGMAWALYRFSFTWSDARQARIVVVVLATTPYIYFAAQYANMDMLVAACITACVLQAAHFVLSEMAGKRRTWSLYSAYAMAAFGVLAKGLIGCALPAAIIVVWLVVIRRFAILRKLVSPGGIAVFALIALPWHIAVQLRFPGFFDYYVVHQHFDRLAGTGFNNVQPWWFYLPVVLVLTMPWSLGLPMALRPIVRGGPVAVPPVRLLMVCWAAFVVAFFSVPQSKPIGYALPAIPPIAWLVGDAIASGEAARFAAHLCTLVTGSAIVLIVVVLGYGIRAPHSSHALVRVLNEQRMPGEPVMFVDTYPYDLEFDSQLCPTILVLRSAAATTAAAPDGWARELTEGFRFAPELAARTVVGISVLKPGASGVRDAWAISPSNEDLPRGLNAQVVAKTSELALWRVRGMTIPESPADSVPEVYLRSRSCR